MPSYRSCHLIDPAWNGPPAPFLDAIFTWNGLSRTVLALIDTGADGTSLPEDIARQMRFRPVREQWVRGVNGRRTRRRVYVANLEIDGLRFDAIEITGSTLDFALIGRNPLNELIANFNGPSLMFSLLRL